MHQLRSRGFLVDAQELSYLAMRMSVYHIEVEHGAVACGQFAYHSHQDLAGDVSYLFGLGYLLGELRAVVDREQKTRCRLLTQVLQEQILLHPEEPCLEASRPLPYELSEVGEDVDEAIVQQVFGCHWVTDIAEAYAEQPPCVCLIELSLGIAIALPASPGYVFFLVQLTCE